MPHMPPRPDSEVIFRPTRLALEGGPVPEMTLLWI
jgi:hypothetical protein